jgi:hypothetical protein
MRRFIMNIFIEWVPFDPVKISQSQEYKDYLEYLKTPEAQQKEDEAWAEVERLERENKF